MAKTADAQFTDEALLAEVQAEIDAMSSEQLEAAAHQSLLATEVRKAKTKSYVKSPEAKARQAAYNKKRNMRLQILTQKAKDLGVEVTDKEIAARLAAS